MGSDLFQRRSIPTQGRAGADAPPTQVKNDASPETPIEMEIITAEIDDNPPGQRDAAEETTGAAESPLVTDAAEAAHDALTDRPTDFSDLASAIESVRAIPSPYDQATRLSEVYHGPLLGGWERCAASLERAAARTWSQRELERKPVLDSYDNQMAAIDAGLKKSSHDFVRQIAQLRDEHEDFVRRSAFLVSEVWKRLGETLDIPEPVLTALSDYMGVGGELVPSSGYDTCSAQAEQLPALVDITDDPVIRKGLPWSVGVALILGGVYFGSFGAGVFTAFWVAGGVVLFVHWRRTNAREILRRLVELTPIEQARRKSIMQASVANLEQRVAEVEARGDEGRRAAHSQRNEQLAEIDSRFQGPIAAAQRVWEADRNAFAGQLAAWAEGVDAALAAQPARIGAWSACPGPDEPAPGLTDQLRVRLGLEELSPLRALDEPTLDLIGTGSVPPALPEARPPVFFDLGWKRSMLLYDERPAGTGASAILATVIARMLMQLPPGKLNLTLFDPVGLGRNYSAFLKLSDYSDLLISGKVWSEKEHLRRKLKELIEHIETVTQKYLRADFADIETYNEKAGEIAEAYRLLVVSDFPEGFDEESTKDLIRIVQNGARCGVFALVHVNRSMPLPYGVELAPLEPFCARLGAGQGKAYLLLDDPESGRGRPVLLDGEPPPELLDEIVRSFGEGAQAAKRVEVPFRRMLEIAKIGEDMWWERSAEKGIEAPLGPAGAKKVQMMRLGSGLAHHALLVGRPGSGKSNLIHVFISTLARLYSPAEVQLYLIDFKKGVEFKAYADALLPHARVIAVESEREFGLSVLRGLDAELKRRGEMFRSVGASSFGEYRQKGSGAFPRIVLIVDEFQEFFSRDDRISREASILFDRLVRQGRAFGIHLILGTQSLANAGLQKATQDQMAVRIALQCSEADSRLILAEDNLIARSLTRPGEAIYNDAAGLIEGNSQFQVAMFAEEDRDRELAAISKVASRKKWKGEPPVVFEGHEPADIAASRPLQAASPSTPEKRLEMWLGEPTALKPPVAATLRRQSGRNLLVLTRDEEEGVGVILAALSSIAAQTMPPQASFRIVDLTAADAEWADHPEALAEAVPHDAEVLGKRDLRTLLPEMEELISQRTDRGLMSEPTVILAIIGLHRARDLRTDEMAGMPLSFDAEPSVNLAQTFEKILQDGPEVGVHTILWCDSFGNFDRVVDRRGLNEIGLRVSGALSPADSHRLFDDDVAAGIDKPHRLVKFDDEHVGMFELFRPYALPSAAFLHAFAARLRSRKSASAKKEKEDG